MKLIANFTENTLKNFYKVHNKLLSKYGFRDAYFYYMNQRIYISGLPSDFFTIIENWIGMQALQLIFEYVTYVPDTARNTYTQFGAYYQNFPVWFLPFNFYETKFVYWDSASSIRSGNNFFNVLSVQKFLLGAVNEKNDQIRSGGSTIVAYDIDGNIIPPKAAPNNQPYPANLFSIKYPINLEGFELKFINNSGQLTFSFDDASNSNFTVKGTKIFSPYTNNTEFQLGLPIFRDSALPFNLNQRLVSVENLDYIQSFNSAICGATILALPLRDYLSPSISNSEFIISSYIEPFQVNNTLTPGTVVVGKQIATPPMDISRSVLYYRTSYSNKDISTYLITVTENALITVLAKLSTEYREYNVNPLDQLIFVSTASTEDAQQFLLTLLNNPGSFPLLVANNPDYNNQDIINAQYYSAETDLIGLYSAQTLSNYPVYTSGYFQKNKWVISKYTQGISVGQDSDCNVIVNNLEKNRTYFDNLVEFSAEGQLPFQILITSKTARQGIRMFANAFDMVNHMELESVVQGSILLLPKWTYDSDTKFYYSDVFTFPSNYPQFKYGGFIGTSTFDTNYTQIYCSLERVVYYKPQPFTFQTDTQRLILMRELVLYKTFTVWCDKPIEKIIFILSNFPTKLINY